MESAMKSQEPFYSCTHCDAQFSKWSGKCSKCGQWGSLQKESEGAAAGVNHAKVMAFDKIEKSFLEKISTGIAELDTVLGGGIVPGSLTLLGGEPGIGKSTLVLQIMHGLLRDAENMVLKASGERSGLYVSGEESGFQIKTRISRLGIPCDRMLFLAETHIESVASAIVKLRPVIVIIDSIQTMYSDQNPAEAGSVNQIRICTVKLLEIAKRENIPIVVIGHITKDGAVAGPKTLEHLVDTVLYLEGDRHHLYRLLRGVKNRFGATDEVGVFEMTKKGLAEVQNPSAIFLDRHESPIPGTVISAVSEGNKPFLVEIQALATKSVFGIPQRKTSGFDLSRFQMLIAVLSKRGGLMLHDKDLHLNVVGGYKIKDTGADMAVCASLILAVKNTSMNEKTLLLGEVGLGGEIRNATHMAQKLKEAEKLGFTKAILPHNQHIRSKLQLLTIKTLDELMSKLGIEDEI